MIRISVFEELADDGAFVKRFGVVFERRDQTAWVQGQQRGWLVVRVDLDVLVRNLLFFQDRPGALDEGAALDDAVRTVWWWEVLRREKSVLTTSPSRV